MNLLHKALRIILILLFVFSLIPVTLIQSVRTVEAAPTLDQSYEPLSINMSSSRLDNAQTFTVGVTGMLTRVDVLISRIATADLLFDLRATQNGVPVESDTAVLVSVRIPAAQVPVTQGFFTIDLTPFNVPVVSGQVLAIVLRSDPDIMSYMWYGTYSPDGYTRGQFYFRHPPAWPRPTWRAEAEGPADDLGFRTFVTTAPVWMKFPGQLSLPNEKYVLDTFVYKDGNTYKMWYTHVKMDLTLEQLFSGLKGLHLDALLNSLQSLQFNNFINHLADLNHDMPALMDIFDGISTVVGYATSIDGKNWAVQNSNALVGSSGGLWTSVGFPTVVKDGNTYKMWYTRVDTTLTRTQIQSIFTDMQNPATRKAAIITLLNSTRTVIGYAKSDDAGASFTVQNPTALAGSGGAWTLFNSVGAPSVILDGTSFKMWYSRFNTTLNGTILDALLGKIGIVGTLNTDDLLGILGSSSLVIGYATSDDSTGSSFTVQNNKVLPGSENPNPAFWQSTFDPCVVKTDGNYEIWYSNFATNLTKPTLINVFGAVRNLGISNLWHSLQTKTFSNFILDLVNINANALRAALTGTSLTIGHATSTNGTTWSMPNPTELTGASPTPWSSVGAPCVVQSLSQTEMWFAQGIPALSWQNIADRVTGVNLGLGYASSKILKSIAIAPSPTASVAKGMTIPFTAIATYSDGSTDPNFASAPGIMWNSTDLNKATFNATGVATGVNVGSTIVSATFGSVTSNLVTLNVNSAALKSIAISPTSKSIPLGKTWPFTATGTYSDNNTADITNIVAWTTSAPGIATIDTAGVAHSVSVGGPITVSATYGTIPSNNAALTIGSAEYESLVITPDNPSVAKGDSIQFSAIAVNTDGSTTDRTGATTWSVAPSGFVNVQSTGQTNPGKATGTAETGVTVVTITASYGSKSDTTQIAVTPAMLTAFRITDVTPHIAAGLASASSLSLMGNYSDAPATDVPIASNATGVTWSSLDTSIATVTADGKVTGVVPGPVVIRAVYKGFVATVNFTVDPPVLVSISISPANTKVKLGVGNVTYTATGTYSDGSKRALTSGLTWSYTSTPATGVITINATTGVVTPAGAGTATVKATDNATSIPGTTGLTITAATLDSITVSAPLGLSVPRGLTRQFSVWGNYSDGSVEITGLVTNWTATDVTGTNIATISSSGLATALNQGTSKITASYGGQTNNVTMTVGAPVLQSIAVTPANTSIAKGRTKQFIATGKYSDQTTQTITSSVTWTVPSSTPAGVATFGATPGLATGQLAGTCTIQATDTVTSLFDTTKLTVTPAVLDSIAVTTTDPTTVAAGGTVQMKATGTYSDTTPLVITNAVTWSTSNGAVASVDSSGKVTSRIVGTANITASSEGRTSNAIGIVVNPATVKSVAVVPVGTVIAKGTGRQFNAIATYTDNTTGDITTSVTWSSTDVVGTSVASVSNVAGTNGRVTGNNKGTANITANHAASGKSGTTSVIITDATLNSITVAPVPANPSIAAGKTQQFRATGNYSDSSTPDLTNIVSWRSSNTTVAQINGAGLATSYVIGTTDITATLGTAGTPTPATLTVTAAVLDSISVTPINPTVTFVAGNAPQVQFQATGINSDGTTVNLTGSVTWTSGTTAAANNPAAGLATTKDPGAGILTTVITADAGSGISSTSTLRILPDTVAPVVTLASPKAGTVTGDKNLTVSGTVDDVNATVSLILNGGAPITLTTVSGNFSQGVTLNNGSNTIAVKAVDQVVGGGNAGLSGTVTVKVDTKKPSINLNSPPAGLLTNNSNITITGTVTNATTVDVIVNGRRNTVSVSSAGAFSAPGQLTPGENVISVSAYYSGKSGDPDYLGTSGVRTVQLDTSPPVVKIDSPIQNCIVSTPGITVSGTLDDPAVNTARLILNNGVPQNVTVVGSKFSQKISLAQGLNTISVQATDAAGNTSNPDARTITLDTSVPGVQINTPTNNLLTNIAGQLVTGVVSDTTITSATLLVNSVAQPPIPLASDGSFNQMASLLEGINTIEVRAADNASPPNIGSSGAIIVTVDTAPPVLTVGLSDPQDSIIITAISSKALNALPTTDVNGTAVTMTEDGINHWIGIYPAAGNPPIPTGKYTVTVVGASKAGANAKATATFSKDTITVTGTAATEVKSVDTVLQVQTNGTVTGASISVTSSTDNPSGNVGNPQNAALGAGAFVEINAATELLNNLKEIYIQVNYDPLKLPSGTVQSTLRLYLWDLSSGTWQIVPGSGVNTTEHFIFGTVSHLSTYGGFGTTAPTEGGGMAPLPLPGTTSVIYRVSPNGQFQMDVVAKSDDSLISLTVPKDTIGKTSAGAPLSEIKIVHLDTPPAVPQNQKAVGYVYDFGPDGATFSPPATVTFTYKDAQIPAGTDEKKLAIAFRDASGNWTKLDSTVDATNNVVTAKTTHFTAFALLIPTAPASFTTTKLTITPSEVDVSQPATVSVLVTNTGDISGSYDVTLKVNSTVVETKKLTLAGGASDTATFTITRDQAGTYSVAIDTMSGSLTVKQPVVPVTPKPAAFTTSGLTVTPAAVKPGETATINVTVTNTGELRGTYTATMKIDGTVVGTQDVTLAGGASQQVTFTTSKSAAGNYVVTIDTLTATIVVQTPVTTPTTPPTEEVEPTKVNWLPIIGGIIGGAIVIVLVVMLVMRRKKV